MVHHPHEMQQLVSRGIWAQKQKTAREEPSGFIAVLSLPTSADRPAIEMGELNYTPA
jgi:hypothetical protein